jgi:L-cysteine:1D-myo-inositol 2-amino-2-deoxy-alpha-D-glucopyranoside ligase
MVLRVALLAHHYREDWEWTDRDLARAQSRLAAWRGALEHTSLQQADHLVRVVRRSLADDLDAPAALDALDAWAAGWHRGDGQGGAVARTLVDARLGVCL